MTARDKFIKRLKEEGLYEEWLATGDRAAKFKDDGTILIFVHYEWEPTDTYDEIHLPTFEAMRCHASFQKECADCFFDSDDDKFVAELARWLAMGEINGIKCPLFPADAYFPGSGLELDDTVQFEDDKDDDVTKTVVEMLRYMADKAGVEIKGNINGVEL